MKLASRFPFAVLALSASFVPSFIACATDSTEPSTADALDGSTEDAPSTSSEDGIAPTSDASVDGDADIGADAEIDADAGPRICTDQGWCHSVAPVGQNLVDVWGDGSGTVWAVSAQGNVFRWDGTTWNNAFTASSALSVVWGTSPTDVWIGGDAGLLHGTGSSSANLTWTTVTLPDANGATLSIRSLWGTSSTDTWAVARSSETDEIGAPKTYLAHASSGANGSLSWQLLASSDVSPWSPRTCSASGGPRATTYG
ncbi:hypothetical protein AKJ09_01724 [Labilithrix luteola]|uniref:Type IV fimbrial biogenesis protein PilY1 n=1 Tax=Labilithrix luteola TaxID=1391654 RepID=A0A0K1PNE2_9BACT|nr:hypothetical protein [Labilithrix luteola]AKU95060.1 hypothetical protein AKJ09_01724 [Labilithrix luteola]